MVKNLNAEFLQGFKPGRGANNLLKLDENGKLDLDGLISDGTLSPFKLAGNSVISELIADQAVTSMKLANEAVTNDKIGGDAVTGDKIKDNSITVSDLEKVMVFPDGYFLDFSGINHKTGNPQGIRLPNVDSTNLSPPEKGEGYIAWDTKEKKLVIFDGVAWRPLLFEEPGNSTDSGENTQEPTTEEEIVE
jgi:hypothetical protein